MVRFQLRFIDPAQGRHPHNGDITSRVFTGLTRNQVRHSGAEASNEHRRWHSAHKQGTHTAGVSRRSPQVGHSVTAGVRRAWVSRRCSSATTSRPLIERLVPNFTGTVAVLWAAEVLHWLAPWRDHGIACRLVPEQGQYKKHGRYE